MDIRGRSLQTNPTREGTESVIEFKVQVGYTNHSSSTMCGRSNEVVFRKGGGLSFLKGFQQ